MRIKNTFPPFETLHRFEGIFCLRLNSSKQKINFLVKKKFGRVFFNCHTLCFILVTRVLNPSLRKITSHSSCLCCYAVYLGQKGWWWFFSPFPHARLFFVMTTTNYPDIKHKKKKLQRLFPFFRRERRQLARFLEVAIFGQKFLGKYHLCHIYYTGGETNVVCLSI